MTEQVSSPSVVHLPFRLTPGLTGEDHSGFCFSAVFYDQEGKITVISCSLREELIKLSLDHRAVKRFIDRSVPPLPHRLNLLISFGRN